MKHTIVPIAGMHCRSCELLLEEQIGHVQGVRRVKVRYRDGTAVVGYTDDPPDQDAIRRAVCDAGYSVGTSEKPAWFTRSSRDYRDLGIAALLLLGVYLLARQTGLLGISVNSASMSIPFALVIGLIAGVSTCMAVVGGLILGISAQHAEQHPEASAWQKFRPHLFFNVGRISSYVLLGGALGSIGSVLKLSNIALALLTVVVGIVMLFLGAKLTGISPRLKGTSITLPSSIAKFLGLSRHQKEYSHRSSIIMGGLTFFLPCGFTQAMQLFAVSTGSFTRGALAMGFFAIGTAPALLSIGGLTSVMKGMAAKRFYTVVGLAVLIFGFMNVRNGFALTGLGGTKTKASQTASANISEGYQTVRMDQWGSGYDPNSFTIKKGIPVKWIITSKNAYTCAASIVMPTYNITRDLKLGENIIEFTPTKTGTINFTCSMGMYRGSFKVVDDTSSSVDSVTPVATTQPTPAAPPSGGSCGSGGCGCGGGGARKAPVAAPAPTIDPAKNVQKIAAVDNAGLSPNEFTVKAGTPVEWTITSERPPVGCMVAFVNPTLGIRTPQQQSGDTIVTFTPSSTGDYDITCPMGMWRATIHVTS